MADDEHVGVIRGQFHEPLEGETKLLVVVRVRAARDVRPVLPVNGEVRPEVGRAERDGDLLPGGGAERVAVNAVTPETARRAVTLLQLSSRVLIERERRRLTRLAGRLLLRDGVALTVDGERPAARHEAGVIVQVIAHLARARPLYERIQANPRRARLVVRLPGAERAVNYLHLHLARPAPAREVGALGRERHGVARAAEGRLLDHERHPGHR
jgi:hypothetical protein